MKSRQLDDMLECECFSPTSAMFEPKPDTVIDNRWRLLDLLASGGMGSVWKGRHEKLGSAAAIKFMLPTGAATDEARRRFEREAVAVAQLKSPNVVRVLDHGLVKGVPYTVMELLEGEDLATRLRHRRRLSVSECCELLEQACQGLSEAHAAGIVHRDLKPANLFITKERGKDLLKVLDFGVAKALDVDGEQTSSGVIIGSPQYMSPEQARAQPIDARSDLWSLGVIAFRLLSGRRLFVGRDVVDTMLQICHSDIPLASKLPEDVPVSVHEFLKTALDRDPNKRFQTAEEMGAAFKALGEAHSDHAPIIEPTTPSASISVPPQRVERIRTQLASGAGTASLVHEATDMPSRSVAARHGAQRRRKWVATMFISSVLVLGVWWATRGSSKEHLRTNVGTEDDAPPIHKSLPGSAAPPTAHSAPSADAAAEPRVVLEPPPPAATASPTRKVKKNTGKAHPTNPTPKPKPSPQQKHPIFGI